MMTMTGIPVENRSQPQWHRNQVARERALKEEGASAPSEPVWFVVTDGIRRDEIEAMDETEAAMVFIERYDLAPREHDFVRATREGEAGQER